MGLWDWQCATTQRRSDSRETGWGRPRRRWRAEYPRLFSPQSEGAHSTAAVIYNLLSLDFDRALAALVRVVRGAVPAINLAQLYIWLSETVESQQSYRDKLGRLHLPSLSVSRRRPTSQSERRGGWFLGVSESYEYQFVPETAANPRNPGRRTRPCGCLAMRAQPTEITLYVRIRSTLMCRRRRFL